MVLSFDLFAILFALSPFALAALAPLLARETGRAAGWILAILPAGLCLALAQMLGHAPQRFAVDWVPALGLSFSFMLDGLSLTFALLITGIGAFVLVYAGAYLEGHRRRGRFLAALLFFMGAMLGLVLADNLVALFAFWELTSVASFLLIGFDREREAARRAALQAWLVTGIGGLALLFGGVLLHVVTGTWDLSALLHDATAIKAAPAYPWILGAVLLAAFTKSAQFPFHFWLPNAMEAPTPVSAYLHSATMVQAGIYLLARLTPALGGSLLWQALLAGFGGVTLLLGAIQALRQTDLKQILAQTTIASLGLMVLLLGIGTDAAITGIVLYFVAHALYKAALFLLAGLIEHETGTRDINALGGLRDSLTIAFIATALAGLSMLGLPPFLGFFAKEEIYAAAPPADWQSIAALAILVLGSALLVTVALLLVVKPFIGPLRATPKTPHGEGPFSLWIGPVLFGLASFAVIFGLSSFGELLLAPMASAISGVPVESHLALAFDLGHLPFWLSLATWLIGALAYWRLASIRAGLARLARPGWSFDRGFDAILFGLVRFAAALTRTLHHGRLELYLAIVFVALALVLLVPLWAFGGWPALPAFPALTPAEWAIGLLAIVGVGAVVLARSRLFAVVALGVQGLAVALIFMLFGAPDLAFTQLMVEILSVVVFALVMTRLKLDATDPRPLEDWLRDGILALVCGVSLALLLMRVVQGAFDSRLGDFFAANSAAIAHGRNIVNVILVDFRGLDTLGEISVVMTAGIAALALLRRHRSQVVPPPPKRAPRRKAAA